MRIGPNGPTLDAMIVAVVEVFQMRQQHRVRSVGRGADQLLEQTLLTC
jgi:hypothetical protein